MWCICQWSHWRSLSKWIWKPCNSKSWTMSHFLMEFLSWIILNSIACICATPLAPTFSRDNILFDWFIIILPKTLWMWECAIISVMLDLLKMSYMGLNCKYASPFIKKFFLAMNYIMKLCFKTHIEVTFVQHNLKDADKYNHV